MGCYNIWRNVLDETASALHYWEASQTCISLHQHIGSKDGIVIDDTVARNLWTITDNATVTHFHVMRKTGSTHDEVAIAYFRSMWSMCTANNHGIFTNHIIIADNGQCFFTSKGKILGNCCHNSSLINCISISHTCAAHQTGIGHNHVVIAYLYILVDIGKWMNRHVLTQFGWRIYIS